MLCPSTCIYFRRFCSRFDLGGGVCDHFGTEGAGSNEEKVVMVGYLTRALDFMS